jgi:hypothetical protein
LPRFDPALGTLNFVDVCITGRAQGSCAVETLDPFPNTAMLNFAVQVDLMRPDTSVIATAIPSAAFTDNLSAFDGTIDFGGTSGVMHTGIDVLVTSQLDLTSAADLALFTGTAGNPGMIVLPVRAQGVSTATGVGHLITQFLSNGTGIVSVCYDYTPVAQSFCAGDGTGTACPCGNDSPIGANAGCLSSIGTGAALRGAGFASVAADSLVLTCSGLPATTSALFFQGTSQISAGAGAVMGDGLRCVGGSVARLGTKSASAGVVSYPQVGDTPISVRGSVFSTALRTYQVWYRNSASFCTVAPFNLSQGVQVSWSP